MKKDKIILVGYGWGSLGFIQHIDTTQYDVVLFSKHDHFLYTPLLAQNVKNDRDLTIRVDQLKQSLEFVHDKIENVDFQKQTVQEKKYDFLVFSHGAEVNTFNIPGVQENTH